MELHDVKADPATCSACYVRLQPPADVASTSKEQEKNKNKNKNKNMDIMCNACLSTVTMVDVLSCDFDVMPLNMRGAKLPGIKDI